MAESMVGLKRTHRCTEVSSADIGSTVTVMGWVAKRRNLGSLIFVDLRDRSGLLQILFDENIIGKEGFDKAYTLRDDSARKWNCSKNRAGRCVILKGDEK